MAFDFPDAPAVGDEYVSGGATYHWTGTTWDLAGVPTAGDFVEKAGDTMVGPLTVQATPTSGGVALRLPNATEPGHIAWLNGDGTRKAWLGAGSATGLTFNLDAAASLNLVGGNLYMEGAGGIHYGNNSAVTDPLDFSKGICLYGYGGTSQFGFVITGGTLNISVQTASNKIDCNVGGSTQLRVQQGTSHFYSNLSCAGTFTSTVGSGANGLSLNDGARVNFSSGCLISKVFGANDFQFHTNANQTFNFHISGTGDVYVIDTVGSTGNSVNVTAPEALALATELKVERRKVDDIADSVDVVKMMAAMLVRIKKLEAEVITLKARK